MKEYKSSYSRLAKLFEKSRDRWKDRSKRKQKQLKYQAIKIRDIEQSREKWKNKSKNYQVELNKVRTELEEFKKKRSKIENRPWRTHLKIAP